MKPADIKSSNEDLKFKIANIGRISKYKNIFAKGSTANCPEEVFMIKKVKNTVLWTYFVNAINGKEIVGTFYEKEFRKTNQKEFRIEKSIMRKRNKLYVKWTITCLTAGQIKKTSYK